MALAFNEDPIFGRVKAVLIKDGGLDGLKEAVRCFRAMDSNHDNELDPNEWRAGMKALGVKLTDKEANYLFIAFDVNMDGLVSIDEFIRHLIGQLNPRRSRVVDRAFEKFQLTSSAAGGPNVTMSKVAANATISCGALMNTFANNTKSNPLVQSGTKTEEQLIRDFAMVFDESRNPNGVITKEEFTGYYAALSTTIAFDDVFEATVLKTWGVDEATAPRLNATTRDWGEKGDPLQLNSPLLHTQALNQTLGDTKGSKAYNSSHMTRNHAPSVPNPSVLPDYISTSKLTFIPYDEQERLRADPMSTRRGNGAFEPTATATRAAAAVTGASGANNKIGSLAMTGNPLIDGIRKKILSRSEEEGFAGLRRSFLVMDMGNDKLLQKQELRAGLQRYRISVTPVEFEQLWNYVDRDTDGHVTVTEFIRSIRGDCLTPPRLNIIRIAFDALDTNHSGCVSIGEVGTLYNVKEHLAVKNGTKTRDQVLQDFVNSWDRNKDGTITWEEWCEYYGDLSASIADDVYFDLMVRNAWNLKSGAGGVSANTRR